MGNQAIGDIADAGAAVTIDGGAQQTHLAHLGHDFAVRGFLTEVLLHTPGKVVSGELTRGITDHALVFGQHVIDQKGVIPLEVGAARAAFCRICFSHDVVSRFDLCCTAQ